MSRLGGPSGSSPAKSAAVVSSQEFVVRVPKATKRRHHVMRFMQSRNQTIVEWNQVRMERENNLKEYRTESDELPKYGAGSEYGRELKDEARRKKYGIVRKKYNPDDQPWLLRVGGKQGKKFKGIREGGVMENASYYVFSKAPDGVFEAYPVDEWYNFTPIQRYKALTAEEAEDVYSRRDKIINHFAIMVKKRLAEAQGQSIEEDKDGNPKESSAATKKNRASLKLSDMDDWVGDSDFSGAESGAEDVEEDSAKKKKKRKDQKKKDKKSQESDSSAKEESDEGDFDDREVDYMTSGSESSGEEPDEKVNKQMKGVEDEDALRQLVLSDEDEEDEDENKKDEDAEKNDEEGDKGTGDGAKTNGDKASAGDRDSVGKDRSGAKGNANKSSDESSSDNSDSDLDDSQLLGSSAVFMQGKRKDGGSRSGTPTKDVSNGNSNSSKKAKTLGGPMKRKKEGTPTKDGQAVPGQASAQLSSQQTHSASGGTEPTIKKPKIELNLAVNLNSSNNSNNNNASGGGSTSSNSNSGGPGSGGSAGGLGGASGGGLGGGGLTGSISVAGSRGGVDGGNMYAQIEGISEEAVRRYLMRKPMTTTELLQKFKSKKTGLSSEQLVNTIAQILKRLNPEKQKIKDKLYLSIKQ